MAKYVVLLSVPGLREKDVAAMPNLRELTAGGEIADLVPSFPCVTCPVQANMTTGATPREHGVVANGFYWRDRRRVEMWTSPNECIERPQIWDLLSHNEDGRSSAVWFPLHSKGCEANYVCTPAPIHNPDGSESLWCYTRPVELYGTLREAGFLAVREADDGEHLDLEGSRAFALADHQLAHVFVRDAEAATIERVAGLFRGRPGIAEVLTGDQRGRYRLDHPRSGEVILVSTPESWQAYYWWLADDRAPKFARTVDIHRKPGYDPVELFFDFQTKSIPLDAGLVKGSHGAPAVDPVQQSVIVASQPGLLPGTSIRDVDVFGVVLRQFGMEMS